MNAPPSQITTKPRWAQERQPCPPNFGRAKRVPRWLLDRVVRRRRPKAVHILDRAGQICEFEEGLVSVVVLSCKRLPELRRLCESMRSFFERVEDYPNIEKILVDNGSGQELLGYAKSLDFFDRIIAHPTNLGMVAALNDVFPKARGEFILLLEDDFVLEYGQPFLQRCVDIFAQFPEIGIIRLKNQNNWWKPYRIIGPLRTTSGGTEFWTWLPSLNGELNVWASGSVLFRKVSYCHTGTVPEWDGMPALLTLAFHLAHPFFGLKLRFSLLKAAFQQRVLGRLGRGRSLHPGYLYECVYGHQYNRIWLAAKVKDCYPFVQPNDSPDSPGWMEVN